jgi:hypothetical protein
MSMYSSDASVFCGVLPFVENNPVVVVVVVVVTVATRNDHVSSPSLLATASI